MIIKELPIRFPDDPYCRALSRLMICVDADSGECYLGVTPDGEQIGRDLLAKLSLMDGEEQLHYTVVQRNGSIVLESEKGTVRLALDLPDRLLIEGDGLILLIGSGKASGMFMSGGSAVDDSLPGALYVNAGVRMRILPRAGHTLVRSSWDLNAMSDPDPRILLYPDETGHLDAAIYATDFDEVPDDDGKTVAAAAAETLAGFDRFIGELKIAPDNEDSLHAAYIIWTALQPTRKLAMPQIKAPLYVSNRRKLGTGILSDNVLLSAFLADPETAAVQLCGFLQYMNASGIVPRKADIRFIMYEAEIPMFGIAFRARPELREHISGEEFAALERACAWWQKERQCEKCGLFYYLHRYETGCGRHDVFAQSPPEFAVELNVCMLLWLDAMAWIAGRLGEPEKAAYYDHSVQELQDSILARLHIGSEWHSLDAEGNHASLERGGAFFISLLEEYNVSLPAELPKAFELPLLLSEDHETREALARHILSSSGNIRTLRRAMTVLAAWNVLKEVH